MTDHCQYCNRTTADNTALFRIPGLTVKLPEPCAPELASGTAQWTTQWTCIDCLPLQNDIAIPPRVQSCVRNLLAINKQNRELFEKTQREIFEAQNPPR